MKIIAKLQTIRKKEKSMILSIFQKGLTETPFRENKRGSYVDLAEIKRVLAP